MEKALGRKRTGIAPGRRRRGKVEPRGSVEDQILKAQAPPGSRFKRYEDFEVQGLEIRVSRCRL